MLRARTVVLITEDGCGRSERAPFPPKWLKHVGLDARGVRWEVELAADVLWVLSAHQAVAVRPHVPDRLDETAHAAVVALFESHHPRIRSLRRSDRAAAEEAFARLAALTEEQSS